MHVSVCVWQARGSGRASSAGAEFSNLSLRRRLRSLQNGLSSASKDSKALSLSLEDRSLKLHSLTTQLEHATAKYDELEKGCSSLQAHLNSLLFQKQKHTAALARSNTLLKYFQVKHEHTHTEPSGRRPILVLILTRVVCVVVWLQRVGGSVGGGDDREGVEGEHGQAVAALQDTCQVVRSLQGRFPHLHEPLARVLDLAHDAAAGAAPE